MVIEARAVSCAPPLLRHVVPFNDGNCRLTISAVVTRYLTALISAYLNAVKQLRDIKHICNEFKRNDICDVDFDSNNWWNLPQTVPVIGMDLWWHALAFITHEIT